MVRFSNDIKWNSNINNIIFSNFIKTLFLIIINFNVNWYVSMGISK